MTVAAIDRNELVAELDLALAALRRVIMRAIDLPMQAAPAPRPIGQPGKVILPPRAPMPPAEVPSRQHISAAGLEIETAGGGGTITFRGISARVSPRQAKLAGVLAKASPNFIARADATARAWPDLAASSREVTVAQAMRCLAEALAPIGIEVEAKPGYGLRLWAAEASK